MVLSLIIGLLCCCCRKKKNRVSKDGDFSMSEEERRAAIVKANILHDAIAREESMSRSKDSIPNQRTYDNNTLEDIDAYPPSTSRSMLNHKNSPIK